MGRARARGQRSAGRERAGHQRSGPYRYDHDPRSQARHAQPPGRGRGPASRSRDPHRAACTGRRVRERTRPAHHLVHRLLVGRRVHLVVEAGVAGLRPPRVDRHRRQARAAAALDHGRGRGRRRGRAGARRHGRDLELRRDPPVRLAARADRRPPLPPGRRPGRRSASARSGRSARRGLAGRVLAPGRRRFAGAGLRIAQRRHRRRLRSAADGPGGPADAARAPSGPADDPVRTPGLRPARPARRLAAPARRRRLPSARHGAGP